MIADMHRLENAARLSMGHFEASMSPAPQKATIGAMRLGAMAIAAAGVLAVVAAFLPA